ncbi:DUF1376 domain-containing protein [Sphingomonas sanxanigenens]|uniref:DUF1376 domain-containing protein n=2 Tax=Sphingomonas sanxanigenens TaxID=397260 RepID=W0ANV4_9SPHN|nr:DUF1376 domain-containing protein [Sphingomonas sanxanigenens]AHE55525.1 hypothetical protein NX02_19305 [Sphingomonas sanxanigenens DSM 19645 = NX02]AHE57415.1 hypothetical protein NX02_29235 [Sphingomonas sanxanigenens DSM 19645 = NX02]
MSDAALPDPLTPPDCDLRGLEYMPLLGNHLFGSEFNARATDSEWRAALTLWWAAWGQVPAASLPDEDTALCRFADLGKDVKSWRKLRAGALHGWVKCADGRLYHPLLAKQALIAWEKRQQDRQARTTSAERKARERADRSRMFEDLAAVGVTPAWNIPTGDLRALVTEHVRDQSREKVTPVTPPVTRNVTAKTGRDGTVYSDTNVSGADAPPIDVVKAMFDEGVALLGQYGRNASSSRSIIGKWRNARGPDWVLRAIRAAKAEATGDPVEWIQGRLRRENSDEDERAAYRRLAVQEYLEADKAAGRA